MAHAYYVPGGAEEGIKKAEGFANKNHVDPDLVVLRYNLFSVEDARKLADIAVAAPVGEHKVITVSVTRFFHEAQNALLKLFEEPPANVTLILVIPSEGMLLPTLRSRLTELPADGTAHELSPIAQEFLSADSDEREKLVTKLVDRSKSDKDEEKQQARNDAVRLAEDLVRVADRMRKGKDNREARTFIDDLMHFLPLLHTRSAPIKLIYEHLLIVIPKGFPKTLV